MGSLGVQAFSGGSQTPWYPALQAAVGRNIEKEESVREIKHKEWKTNGKTHTGMTTHPLAKDLNLFQTSSVVSQKVTSCNAC